ncbi:hypothetical protein CF15_00035 [Pyrodictium occultum]|uniref:TldD/PmbA family protein n=1 Tax=Pyrodictium occultum TaxID=2309 RepID=A0A0V8RTB6_PYROC|nr:TldD/PmbA family protein [Pyrodictium occultum]KSW11302.1 hypothetical protein CF15_00035 [Pyrodictium occultum]
MSSRIAPAELAVMAARWAMREGASEAEVYVSSSRGYSVSIRTNAIEAVEAIDDVGVGIRVAVGKRVGFSYTTGMDPAGVREAARRAVKQARASPEDRWWQGFPEPSSRYAEPGGIYSPVLARVSPGTVVEHARGMLEKASGIKGLVLGRGGVSVYVVERVVVNTNGVYRVDVGTTAHVYAGVVMRRDGATTPMIYEFDSSRVAIPDGGRVVERAADTARLCTRVYSGLETGRYTLVLSPKVLAELMEATVLYSLRGDIYVQGRSYYGDKLGSQALSEKVTIVDDGTMKGGDATWRFDGEGVATSRKILVEKGVVKGFVFDSYWGRRAGKASTGNAARSGYTSKPMPGFTNVVVEPGDAAPEELLEGRVLVIHQVQGAHTASSDTGEYSVLANPAIYYENGEPRGWVPGAVLSGNFYREMRDSLEALGKLVEKAYPGVYMPWARVAGSRWR